MTDHVQTHAEAGHALLHESEHLTQDATAELYAAQATVHVLLSIDITLKALLQQQNGPSAEFARRLRHAGDD